MSTEQQTAEPTLEELTAKYQETKMRESQTVHSYIDGETLRYSGDPHGPHLQVFCEATQKWKSATNRQRLIIRRETLAETIIDKQVLYNQSSLIDEILGHYEDSLLSYEDDVENLYVDSDDWTIEQCREYLDDEGGDSSHCIDPWNDSDLLTYVRNEHDFDTIEPGDEDGYRELMIEDMNNEVYDGIEDWREACREHSLENPAEVYEWWLVTEELFNDLRQLGQVVIYSDFGRWWGRCCTGQSIILDGTMQAVACLRLGVE